MAKELEMFYTENRRNRHTTEYRDIDDGGERWLRVYEDDESSYFVSDYGHVVKKDRVTFHREYMFGNIFRGEFYVPIGNRMLRVADLVVDAFLPKVRVCYKDYEIQYINEDKLDPSLSNIRIIGRDPKKLLFDDDKPDDTSSQEPYSISDQPRYIQQIIDIKMDDYEELDTPSERFRYYFNRKGEGFMEDQKTHEKYIIPVYEDEGGKYVSVCRKKIKTADIAAKLFF